MRTYIEGISLRLTVPRHLTLSFKFDLSSVLMIIIYLNKKKTQLLIILQSNLLALDVKPFISLVSFYNQVATNEWPKMTADILWKCLSLLVYGHVRVINVVTAGILIRACLLMRDLDINVICADSQWRFYCQRLASHHSFSSGG